MRLGEVTLGRTRRAFPRVWLSLSAPLQTTTPGWAQDLAKTAESLGVPIDVSSQPALWGSALRASKATLLTIGGTTVERATSAAQAADFVQAELIQALSAIGRDYFDVFFFRHRRTLDEYQVEGVLSSLEMARQEGHIRHVGLLCDRSGPATLAMWRFHDAFEIVMAPRNPIEAEAYSMLAPLASERNVGVATYRPVAWDGGIPFVSLLGVADGLAPSAENDQLVGAAIGLYAKDHPVMVGVRSSQEAVNAVSILDRVPNDLSPEFIATVKERYRRRIEPRQK